MSSSIFSPNNRVQTVIVQDCQPTMCPTPDEVLARGLAYIDRNVMPLSTDNVSFAMANFIPINIHSVVVVGKNQERIDQNSFNALRMSGAELTLMHSKYGMINQDAEIAIDKATAVVPTSATLFVNTAVSPNTDHIFVPAFSKRLRLFARLVTITVPQNIASIDIQPSGTASSVPELITVNFNPDDCRDLTLLVFNRAQSYQFVGKTLAPTDELTLFYKLPLETADNENGVTGGSIFLQTRVRDTTGAQVVANLTVSIWQIPYTAALMSVISSSKGIYAPGATAIFQPQSPVWAVPLTQPAI